MEVIETYFYELVDKGEIPKPVYIDETIGKEFKNYWYMKEYFLLIFEPNICAVGKMNTENGLEFIEDVGDEFIDWDWYAYVKVFLKDEEKLKEFRHLIQNEIVKQTEERQYKAYLELKEKFKDRG